MSVKLRNDKIHDMLQQNMTTDMAELGQFLLIFFHNLILELTGKIGPVPCRNGNVFVS